MERLTPFARTDISWSMLLRGLWKYQWTKQSVEYSEELGDTLYQYSRGNIDMTIKLYMAAQRIAISNGSECITKQNIILAGESDAFKMVLDRLAIDEENNRRFMSKATTKTRGAGSQKKQERNEALQAQIALPKSEDVQLKSKKKTGKVALQEAKEAGEIVSMDDDY